MDKLRALQYFVAAAGERSLSGAARRHEVSLAAVAKLVAALERSLGARLFDRSSRGLALTAEGERYLETCQPLLAQLAAADEDVSSAAARPTGHARYPDIELDFRVANQLTDADAAGADVCVLFGWHEAPDFVQRPVAQNLYVVLASPVYWEGRGRAARRTLRYTRASRFAARSASCSTCGSSSAAARRNRCALAAGSQAATAMLIDAALAGEGVIRSTDLIAQPLLRAGRLRPALDDWHGLNAPPANVFFRPQHRRTPRVRVFVDHVAETFRRLEANRAVPSAPAGERPSWYATRHARASAATPLPR